MAKFWSLDGKELATLTGYPNGFAGISFSPDGKIIAMNRGLSVILVNFDLEQLAAIACNWLRDYLKYSPNVGKNDSLRNSCT